MEPKKTREARLKERHLAEFQHDLALERFREERPNLWLQFTRVKRLLAIQAQLPDETFPPGCCFLHGSFTGIHSFCIRRVTDVDLDTCQITVEVHGDEDLEEGHVLLPLESIEWFGFPARAVPTGLHIVGFAVAPKKDA